jgi:soluble P-type ATPase
MDLSHLLLDLNGTIADSGQVIEGVKERIDKLRPLLTLKLLSADTLGLAQKTAEDLSIAYEPVSGSVEKRAVADRLGRETCVAIGNGMNDALLLEAVALGIAVIGPEGASLRALSMASVACTSVVSALDLLLRPAAINATLRF